MANTIKQKRGTTNPSASDLVVGELAINTTDGGVFTKTDGGTVVEVGQIAAGAVGSSELASTAVTAATYGASQSGVPSFTVDADGRLTAASTDTSPTFSGTVTSGGNPSAATGVSMNGSVGEIRVQRSDNSSPILRGYDTNGTQNVTINANGSASFNGNVDLQDNDRLRLGTNDDLQIYHNGSSSLIQQTGTGNLFISNNVDDQDVVITCDDGSGGTTTYFRADGSSGEVKLYHYGTEKFNTKSDGVDITGELQCDSLDVDGNVDITGTTTLHGNLDLQDSDKILLGTGDDLQIYHDGNHSQIQDVGTGNLQLLSNHFKALSSDGSEAYITAVRDGAVELYHNNSKKIETTSTGATITGKVTATGFDLASLSALP